MPLLLMKLLLIQLYRERFKNFLSHQSISYTEGKVWSTDGIYRETQSKMLARKAQGAIAVDMECSAIAALANFRQINHFSVFLFRRQS